jgi:hypothetical protein
MKHGEIYKENNMDKTIVHMGFVYICVIVMFGYLSWPYIISDYRKRRKKTYIYKRNKRIR